MHWSYQILPHHRFFLFNNQPSLLFSFLFLFLFLFITITVSTTPQLAYSLYFGDTINIIESNKSALLSSPQLAATEGGNVYAVWVEKNILYFKSSHDNGSKFNTPIILSKNVNLTSSPQLAATEGGNVYAVWVEKNILYFKSSHDNGSKFNTPIILSKNVNLTSSPQLAATEGGNVYAVWVDKNILYFKSSHDNGSKFNTPIILSKNVNLTSSPQLAATEGGNVYAVWVDKKNNSTFGGDTDIVFKWSKDAGKTFKSKKLSRGLSASSLSPQLAATEGGNVYAVWVDKKNNSTFGGDTDIVFKWSKDAGKTFKSKKLSRGLSASSLSPQLAATEGGNVYAVWVDKKNNSTFGGDTDIVFKWSKDAGKTFKSKKLSRGLSASSLSPQLAATEGGNVYVVWSNNQTNFKEILGNNAIFGETIKISNNTDSAYPQLAATEDGNVYLIWIANKHNTETEKVLYFKRISNFLFD